MGLVCRPLLILLEVRVRRFNQPCLRQRYLCLAPAIHYLLHYGAKEVCCKRSFSLFYRFITFLVVSMQEVLLLSRSKEYMDNTRDRLYEFCAQAGLKPIREPGNLLRDRVTDTAFERRPDIALPGVDSQGRLLLLDVITTDVGCTTALKTHKSVSERCGAARGAEAAKRGVYENLVDANSQSFMPLAFEMQGRWRPSAGRLFGMEKFIALEKRELQGQRHSFWAGFWRRTISVGSREIARSALNIQSQLLEVHDLPRRSYRRHFLDLGRM